MACDRRLESLISAYADSEASVSEARVLRLHMLSCRFCRMDLRRIRKMKNAIRAAAIFFSAADDWLGVLEKELRRHE